MISDDCKETTLLLAMLVFEECGEAILITDDKANTLRSNKAFEEITGYASMDIVGKNPRLLQSGKHGAVFYQSMWELIKNQGDWQGEIWNRRQNGEIFPAWETISVVKNAEGQVTHYIAIFQDITKHKETEARMQYLAYYDPLTQLPNRSLLTDRLEQSLGHAKRSGEFGAFLFLDLDHFKKINDTFGHLMGDEVLRQVAKRVAGCLRQEDTVARLGGDEFVALLNHSSKSRETTMENARNVGEKILRAVSEIFRIEDHLLSLTVSIGIAIFPDEKKTVCELLDVADIALYQAKGQGRDALYFYSNGKKASTEQCQVEAIRAAFNRGQFAFYFQPRAQIKDNRVVGVEAFLNYYHTEKNRNSLQDVAGRENTGSFFAVSTSGIKSVCQKIQQWQSFQSGLCSEHFVSIKVTSMDFLQADFVMRVDRVVNETAIDPERLELELPEGILFDQILLITNKLNRLKELGVRLSIGNFGTGNSSLAVLKQLPLDVIKIDRSFVQDINKPPRDFAFVQAIIMLTKSLGCRSLAEGVKSESQLDCLRSIGCDDYQGYFHHLPVPQDDFIQFLQSE